MYPAILLPSSMLVVTPVVEINNQDYYDGYSFYVYVMLLILLLLFVTSTLLAIRRRRRTARALAERRLQAGRHQVCVAVISDEQMITGDRQANSNMARKDMDLPPTYDEVIKTNTEAKLQLHPQEDEGPEGGVTAVKSGVPVETAVISAKFN